MQDARLFELPDELRQYADMLRRFVDRELIPLEHQVGADGTMPSDIQDEVRRKAKAAGIWMLDVPEEHGGQGLDTLAMAVFWEQMGRTITVPPRDYSMFGPAPGPILLSLDGDQRQRYLQPVLDGLRKTCFAQTEPDAGSDPSAMRTKAERRGDIYVLNGVKRFITGAAEADFAQVMAVTDPKAGGRGLSCLLIDFDMPGVKIAAHQETMMGERPCELVFENVEVPAANLVGAEGDGVRLAQGWINHGRIRHGARGCGVATRCLELAAAYARQRVTFGAPLADRQGIQWILADAYLETHAARLMVHQAAAKLDRGEDARSETFMVKIFGDEMSFRAADRCMQIFGGMGLTTELPIQRFWRDQRSFMITEGPTEVLRTALARDVLKRLG